MKIIGFQNESIFKKERRFLRFLTKGLFTNIMALFRVAGSFFMVGD